MSREEAAYFAAPISGSEGFVVLEDAVTTPVLRFRFLIGRVVPVSEELL